MTENRQYNQKLLIDLAMDKFTKDMIATSKMVSDGRLSSTGGKEVASIVIANHAELVNTIKFICKEPANGS